MSSAPSFRELMKAICNFLPNAALPLPDDLVESIEAYLAKHPTYEQGVADKVNEELLAIFKKDVADVASRYGPFLAILRLFRPISGTRQYILEWWELLQPIVDHFSMEKGLAAEGQAVVLDILTSEVTNDTEGPLSGSALPLAERIMAVWFADSEASGLAEEPMLSFKETQYRDTLIKYGKKRPQGFMTVLNGFVVNNQYRVRALILMAQFIQSQPPHLHQILQTPLYGNLITCLQQDTSTSIVSVALTVLTMILPHMPGSLVPHLPVLFNIYARLLFWEREIFPHTSAVPERIQEPETPPSSNGWVKKEFVADLDDSHIPQLLNYFTILYGLYPINFMDYIRKPQRYLRHANASSSDDIEVQPSEIRHASERFRQCHLLHENFYSLTIESETENLSRWSGSEAAEIVADCMALRQTDLSFSQDATDSHFQDISVQPTDEDLDGNRDAALLSSSVPLGSSPLGLHRENLRSLNSALDLPYNAGNSPVIPRQPSQNSYRSNRDSSDSKPLSNTMDSPTLSGQLVKSGSHSQLQDMINSNKAIKSGFHQTLANDSVPSLSLSHQESIPEKLRSHTPPAALGLPGPERPTEVNSEVQLRHLYRQILLLQNDLAFERFMKQQHLTHMGALRRKQIREAASEAETQNLIISNRTLKMRLDEAKKTELQTKKESEMKSVRSKKWEAELSTKLKTLREEKKKWTIQEATLKSELEAAKIEAEKLRDLICEVEVRELGLKQDMQSVEININELERLRKEVDRLTIAERDSQAHELERQAKMTEAAEADRRAEILQMKLTAREAEVQQTKDFFQSQVVVLNAKLQDALRNGTERKAEGFKVHLESALAASKAQELELKKRVLDLTRKNTALQASLWDIQSTIPTQSRSETHRPFDSQFELSSDSGSPLSFRNRQARGLSDPEAFEATSYNPTPPLEAYNVLSTSTPVQRPSTPAGTELSATGSHSPTSDRYHGRGGIQNTIRKEKKDKKASGIRGIRGLI